MITEGEGTQTPKKSCFGSKKQKPSEFKQIEPYLGILGEYKKHSQGF